MVNLILDSGDLVNLEHMICVRELTMYLHGEQAVPLTEDDKESIGQLFCASCDAIRERVREQQSHGGTKIAVPVLQPQLHRPNGRG